MTSRTRVLVAIYLIMWTTVVAAWSVSFMMATNPGLGSSLPFLVYAGALIAALAALRWSRWLVRGRATLGWPRVLFYFAATPAMIFVTVALLVSLLFLFYAPIALSTGMALGVTSLAVGTVVHLAGILPLWLVSQRVPII
jgi:hypothetical protein